MAWAWRLSSVTFRCCLKTIPHNHHSVFTTWKWRPFATWTPIKFHHPSLRASPPNRGKSICLPPELSLLLKRRSVNKFRHRYSMLWPLIMYTIMWYWISFDSFCLLTEILKGIWVCFAIFRQRNVTKTMAIKPLVPSPVYSVYCRHRQSDCRSVINNEAGSRRTMLECCCRKLKKFPKIPTDGWLSQH